MIPTNNPPIAPTSNTSDKGTPVVSERIQYDDNPRPAVMSANTFIGEKVINPAKEHIGEIKDIMLDVPTGRIAYAVLAVGGFLGIGEQLFAIPWKALMIDANHERFVLDVDKERLKNAEGFDKDNWPTMADREWAARLHDYYKVRPYWE